MENPVPVSMEESGPHKQSILRNKEVSLKNAPRKPRDVTRPTVMVKILGFRGTLPVKYKIVFWNNPITASILVWNQVVLNQSQQLGYLNSKLMLSWDCPFKLLLLRLSHFSFVLLSCKFCLINLVMMMMMMKERASCENRKKDCFLAGV